MWKWLLHLTKTSFLSKVYTSWSVWIQCSPCKNLIGVFFSWHSHYVFHFHLFIFSNMKHTCIAVCNLSFTSKQLQNVLMQYRYGLCPKYSVHARKYLNCSYIARSVIATIVLECSCNSLHASLHCCHRFWFYDSCQTFCMDISRASRHILVQNIFSSAAILLWQFIWALSNSQLSLW